ncbi:MAG: hypothetical protein H8E98_07115 [Bacteroidetes bacterium]|nr:hypothetical protein [Bacteroidota bacterium]
MKSNTTNNISTLKQPPVKSKNIFSDIRFFFLQKPEIDTKVIFHDEEEREQYRHSILQRNGIGVDEYKLLNIHRIGIEAPASYVFEELLNWDGDSTCWPNNITKVHLPDGSLEKVQILLFGLKKHLFGLKNGIFGFHFLHLFDMDAIKIQRVPAPFDFDNARYMLFKCKGGYPIGVFSMYVRTSIHERGEQEMSQFFIMVGFNFYGKKSLSKVAWFNKIWEAIHNRVTANVANRIKLLCEWRYEKLTNG